MHANSNMSVEELRALVATGEGLNVEFKLRLPEPEKLVKEAIALANAKGGWLLIGVDDDGTIPGLRDPDEAIHAFHDKCEKLAKPPLMFNTETIPISRKRSVVAVHLPESSNKPHQLYLPGCEKGTAYYRVNDKSMKASTELFRLLHHEGREEGTKFEYGEKEKRLMQYLETHPSVTVEEFAELAKIRRHVASRTLVILTRARVLKLVPGEVEDRFFLLKA